MLLTENRDLPDTSTLAGNRYERLTQLISETKLHIKGCERKQKKMQKGSALSETTNLLIARIMSLWQNPLVKHPRGISLFSPETQHSLLRILSQAQLIAYVL